MTMAGDLPPSISSVAIVKAIELACLTASSDSVILWKGKNPSPTNVQRQQQQHHLLYCIVGETNTTVNNTNTTVTTDLQQQLEHTVAVYFYFAYSTWDGRILYIDKIIVDNNSSNESNSNSSIILSVYKILANIATTLHCCRLNWQHVNESTIIFPGTIQPQTMHGWLTLHWNTDSIKEFLSSQDENKIVSNISDDSNSKSSMKDVIESTIEQCNSSTATTPSTRRLRLATHNDVDTIRRLVQGLADYEKEPDALNVTNDQYRLDGFQSDPPLFYCILLEVHESDIWYSCGMAFCWIGQIHDNNTDDALTIKDPLFLYLEDLFIEEPYRGGGSGTQMMTVLGEITLALNCKRMVWQALDWNTPALTFYQNKIGAHIVHGLLTTRFAGSVLLKFNESFGIVDS